MTQPRTLADTPGASRPGEPRRLGMGGTGADWRTGFRAGAALLGALVLAGGAALAEEAGRLSGAEAMGEWRSDKPGLWRLIRPQDLPAPYATPAVANMAGVVPRPEGRVPTAPPGYKVTLWASGLQKPRTLRTAPNGDIFVAETSANRISVLRPDPKGGQPEVTVFAEGLNKPYGLAFYPPGPDPRWIYVGNTDGVVRFSYRPGERRPAGAAETVVKSLPTGGHGTRDIAFSKDGKRMFVAVGSRSNVAEGETAKGPAGVLGASGGDETERAAVLAFDPEGGHRRIFATGIRNCSGLATNPRTGDLWCSTNERDGLGDDLVPDYLTRVREGQFYGWPWYYVGDHEDPRHKGARPDLKGKVSVPDVLLQAHSASLGMTFYEADAFPADVRGDAFAAEHGSWNRAKRTGYKVIRARLKDGVPTGEYQDFLTGFVVDDKSVWGRPVGVTVDAQGGLLVSEDAGGTIWRVTWEGGKAGP
ncbi:MAG: PQQ-dependent sugar dehydrogenase [Alsobacter sp.]